jgi:hypothetical protein
LTNGQDSNISPAQSKVTFKPFKSFNRCAPFKSLKIADAVPVVPTFKSGNSFQWFQAFPALSAVEGFQAVKLHGVVESPPSQ